MKRNILLSSRRLDNQNQPKSYLNRYRQINQNQHQSKVTLRNHGDSIWSEEEIQERRQKIIQNLFKQSQISRIRIQEQSMQTQFFKDDYLDLQIMWLKKVDQIKEETHKLHLINQKQSKTIDTLKVQVQTKREKLKQLQGRIQDINRTSQDTATGDEDQQAESVAKQQMNIIQDYQNQLNKLQKERQAILKANQQLESSIKHIQANISEMQPKITHFKRKQSEIRAKKQALLLELRQIKSQNRELQKAIQKTSKIEEDTDISIAEYIQLAQNVFIMRQIQKLQQLMISKQTQEERKEIYSQNNKFLKEKNKELQVINARVRQKERVIQKLTFDIKQKSIEQLNLYNY